MLSTANILAHIRVFCTLRELKAVNKPTSKCIILRQTWRSYSGGCLSDEQMQAEIGTFIMAGYETTAHTLSFAIYNIARHASVQSNISSELKEAGLLQEDGSCGRELQFDDLRALEYMGNVLKESMRMYPVVAAFPRYGVLVTITLNGCLLKRL